MGKLIIEILKLVVGLFLLYKAAIAYEDYVLFVAVSMPQIVVAAFIIAGSYIIATNKLGDCIDEQFRIIKQGRSKN